MEIASLVIAILAFISATALWFAKVDEIHTASLQSQIDELKKLNKYVYKDLVEEYRLLIKSYSEVKYHLDGVEFNPYIKAPINEFVLYSELESKIAEVKALKARLCDTQCITKSYANSGTINVNNGTDSVSIPVEEFIKNNITSPKKKPRKKK